MRQSTNSINMFLLDGPSTTEKVVSTETGDSQVPTPFTPGKLLVLCTGMRLTVRTDIWNRFSVRFSNK